MELARWDVAAGSIATLPVVPASLRTIFPRICPVGLSVCFNILFVCLPLRAVQLAVLLSRMLIKFNSKPKKMFI